MSDRYAVPRIGVAVSHVRERDGRADRYHIHEERAGQLYVSYAGYEEGSVITGTALGGHGWTPPNYFWTDTDRFASVTMFANRW